MRSFVLAFLLPYLVICSRPEPEEVEYIDEDTEDYEYPELEEEFYEAQEPSAAAATSSSSSSSSSASSSSSSSSGFSSRNIVDSIRQSRSSRQTSSPSFSSSSTSTVSGSKRPQRATRRHVVYTEESTSEEEELPMTKYRRHSNWPDNDDLSEIEAKRLEEENWIAQATLRSMQDEEYERALNQDQQAELQRKQFEQQQAEETQRREELQRQAEAVVLAEERSSADSKQYSLDQFTTSTFTSSSDCRVAVKFPNGVRKIQLFSKTDTLSLVEHWVASLSVIASTDFASEYVYGNFSLRTNPSKSLDSSLSLEALQVCDIILHIVS